MENIPEYIIPESFFIRLEVEPPSEDVYERRNRTLRDVYNTIINEVMRLKTKDRELAREFEKQVKDIIYHERTETIELNVSWFFVCYVLPEILPNWNIVPERGDERNCHVFILVHKSSQLQ